MLILIAVLIARWRAPRLYTFRSGTSPLKGTHMPSIELRVHPSAQARYFVGAISVRERMKFTGVKRLDAYRLSELPPT